MNKFEKILFKSGIIINIIAGVTSLIYANWILGVTQLCLATFMSLYMKKRNK